MNTLATSIGALIPSLGVGMIFYLAVRAIIRADRNERAALAELEEKELQSR